MAPDAKRSLLGHAFLAWALCAATLGIGAALTPLPMALVSHAIAAPILAAVVARHHFRRWRGASPGQAALTFVVVAMAIDFLLVALVINHSLAMFRSWVGTWIPLALIFVATYLTGRHHSRPDPTGPGMGSATS
jgi:hypothetical protein